MNRTMPNSMAMLVCMLAAANPILAHHSRAMFDVTQNITYRGFVKEWKWQNPHTHIVIVVGDDATDRSTIGTWDIEASSVSIMVSQGWNGTSFSRGDRITVVAHPSKSGSSNVLLFYAIKPDGTRLYRAHHRYDSEAE
jgi:trehalose-6-phosphatase